MKTALGLVDPGDLPAQVDVQIADIPQYRVVAAVDITGYGSRDEYLQDHVRNAMYAVLEVALRDVGMAGATLDWRDQGDGVLLVLPAGMPASRVFDQLVPHLMARLRRYNMVSSEEAQIALRMAVHVGLVRRDKHGLTGKAVVTLARMLDAPAFKKVVRSWPNGLRLMVSDEIFGDVILPERSVQFGREAFSRITLRNKESRFSAWICVQTISSRAAMSNGEG